MKMLGSCMIANASSKEEVMEVLKQDIYAQSGVWDINKVCLITLWQVSFWLFYLLTNIKDSDLSLQVRV